MKCTVSRGERGNYIIFFSITRSDTERIQCTVHLNNFLTSSHCNVLSRIRRDTGRGRIINPGWLFASYNRIIIERNLRISTLGRKN